MALRFKLDENIPGEAASLLRSAGHDVRTALEQQLGGNPDERVFRVCQDEARVLVTLDLGFGDIRAYPPGDDRLAHHDFRLDFNQSLSHLRRRRGMAERRASAWGERRWRAGGGRRESLPAPALPRNM